MAAEIRDALDIEATLIPGGKGEFTVRVDGRIVAQKSGDDFPSPAQCLLQVQSALTTA